MRELFLSSAFDGDVEVVEEMTIVSQQRQRSDRYDEYIQLRSRIDKTSYKLKYPITCEVPIPIAKEEELFFSKAQRLHPGFYPVLAQAENDIELDIISDQIRAIAFCVGTVGMFGIMILLLL